MTLLSCLLFLPFVIGAGFHLPESARWMLSKGDTEGAMRLLRQVAKTNGVAFPANAVLHAPSVAGPTVKITNTTSTSTSSNDADDDDAEAGGGPSSNTTETCNSVGDSGASTESPNNSGTIKELFMHPVLRKRLIIMAGAWATCSLLYYGLTAAGSNLTGTVIGFR
jgi:hypothetical protein